jgi:hypothetical protein
VIDFRPLETGGKALGLVVPAAVLARAIEVIE